MQLVRAPRSIDPRFAGPRPDDARLRLTSGEPTGSATQRNDSRL
jgi:hypothetical protein